MLERHEENFALYFPHAAIESISYNDLPYRIRKNLDGKDDCGLALQITHLDLSKTFVGENLSLEAVFLQDRDSKNKYAGEGQIFLEAGNDEPDIPVVGFTFTALKYRRNGLGKRRLQIMDAVTRSLYQDPLYSSGSPRPEQRSIWEHLVNEEIAEIVKWQETKRYKFIK